MKNAVKPKGPALSKKSDIKESSAVAAPASEQRTWKAGPRPPGANACQDTSFTLEDETLSSSLEVLFSCFCCWDPSLPGCPIVNASPGFEALTGYSCSEFVGRTSSSKLLQGPRTEPEAVAALSAGVDSKSFTAVEITLHKNDSRPFRSLVCLVPLLDATGAVACWCEVHCDLDEKKRGVDEHIMSRWSEQVKHYSSNYLLMEPHSEEGRITSLGSGLGALTGYTQSNLAGCSCLSLAGPDTSQGGMRKLMGTLSSQKQVATTMLLHKRDGSAFWAHVVGCPLGLTREQQQGLLGYCYSNPVNQHYGSQASAAMPEGLKRPSVLVLILDVTQQRPKRLGKYILGKVLGQGASGLVRMGKNTSNDELVAVKSVDASRFRSLDEIQQVQEEMAVLSQLKHPSIIRLQEVHFMGNVFFFIMDWASGGSMVQYIYQHEGHALPEQEARRIFVQLLSGLEYCHKRRVIHRDLKPENILMEGGNPKIADFGLAGVMAPFNASGFTLQCGTPEFTAPEIVNGKEYEGTAVDLWSVGVMLYEALAGELPFKGPTQSALFKAIQKGVYAPLPDKISAEAKDLVKRLLSVDPAQRIRWADLNRHPWLTGTSGSSGSSTAGSGTTGPSGLSSTGAVGSAGGTEAGAADGSSRSRRGSEGDDENLPCREVSDAAALSDSSELSASHLEEGPVDDGEEGWHTGEGTSGAASSSGLNSSLRSNRDAAEGGSSWADTPDGLRVRGGGVSGGGLSFTSHRCHDSVRVVIPGGAADKDDPILAAIMRTAESFSAGASPASAAARSHLAEEAGGSGSPVSPRSASFSTGSGSPVTPGVGRGGLNATGPSGLSGGAKGPLGAVAKSMGASGAAGAGARGLRNNSSSNLPPLSPSSSVEGSSGTRRVASISGQPAPGSLGAPRGAERMASKEPLKNYAAGLGAGGQQKGGGGGGGSGQASPTSMLPPIGREKGLGRSLR